MQVRLRVFAVLFASLCLTAGLAQAQTPGTGWVNIAGLLQGPVYPCGNSTCPTYDSGEITIMVNGFSASANYSKARSQKTATQLANALASKLNTAASPVTAIVAKSKITMTAKFAGWPSNYPLSTSVTYNAQFAMASFTATASGPALTGGTGGPASIGTLAQQTSNNTSLCSASGDPGGNLAYCSTFFADLNGRAGYPLKFGILEDKGALKSTCPTSSQTESATVTCLQNALMTEVDFINTHYANSSVYWTDAGQPVLAYFGGKADWPILTFADWDSIWSAVKGHTDAYSTPSKYVFQFGSFTANAYDGGRYGWLQPPAYGSTQQFWWGSNISANPLYLDNLYSAGLRHPSQLTIGALYKGFDDYNASWSANRVIAQQCGQVLLKTTNEISKYFGGANPQIPYVQVITWNDYEEGTATEEGIDNCYTVNSTISGNILSWTLIASDSMYASTSTVHHFNVYFADAAGNLYPAASNLPGTTSSLDLSSLVPPGTWTMYVEMVGQPLVINRVSNGVSYVH